LFPGSKERYRLLEKDALAYLSWFDERVTGELVFSCWNNFQHQFLNNVLSPVNLIIDQFANLNDSRLKLLNYDEQENEAGFPSYVECYSGY
jgi:hypothetical protein